MTNCALFRHGSNEIAFFIRSCTKTKGRHVNGWDYCGDNMTVRGIKPAHFAELWTDDEVLWERDSRVEEDRVVTRVSELREARRWRGRVVSSRSDVNAAVREEIRKNYDIEDEIQILRERDARPDVFERYQGAVEGILSAAREFKDKHFAAVGGTEKE